MRKINELSIRYDSAENWAKAKNFIPQEGTIIVYNAASENEPPRIKIGDGRTKVNDLPFTGSSSFEVEDNILFLS